MMRGGLFLGVLGLLLVLNLVVRFRFEHVQTWFAVFGLVCAVFWLACFWIIFPRLMVEGTENQGLVGDEVRGRFE